MTEAIENNKQAIKAIKQYCNTKLDERGSWKIIVNKYFQGNASNAGKMLVAIMSFPNLFEE